MRGVDGSPLRKQFITPQPPSIAVELPMGTRGNEPPPAAAAAVTSAHDRLAPGLQVC
jgi:hypothetical protein